MHQRIKSFARPALCLGCVAIALTGMLANAQEAVLKSQADRVAVVGKVKPTAVAIFAKGGAGGGTGVLISEEGYALTNFHVVQPTGPTMKCGLADGVLYDAVLVAQDKVGDVALIKLLPPDKAKPDFKFPFAALGDSDLVREGDWSIAMGNPFLLATDFTPTVTFGLISGVHRYQYPAGTILEYTDCIQIDTSINPGNSGGPLYNLKGEIIGINGRGSFDKRGRINSGVGYAISINQIKNFLGHLMAGIEADHASLGALVSTGTDDTGRITVTSILTNSDVAKRGLDLDDVLVSFAGRPMGSVNQYKNVLGIFPRGWRVPLEYRGADRSKKEILVRLMGAIPREVGPEPKDDGPPKGPPMPKGGPAGPGAKLYSPRPGYTNYYFNKLQKERLVAAFKKHGDFAGLDGEWVLDGTIRLKKLTSESPAKIEIRDDKGAHVRLTISGIPEMLDPLAGGEIARKGPAGSGGFLAAIWVYKQLLTRGEAAFATAFGPEEKDAKGDDKGDKKDKGDKGAEKERFFHHGGWEPFYPPPIDGKGPARMAEWRVDTEVINSRIGNYYVKWFFSRADQKLLGFELRVGEDEDPCEVFFADYRAVDGRMLPHRIQVTHNNGHYGTILVSSYKLAK